MSNEDIMMCLGSYSNSRTNSNSGKLQCEAHSKLLEIFYIGVMVSGTPFVFLGPDV